MKWENSNDVLTLIVSKEVPLKKSIEELCAKVISGLIPKNEDVNWDHLRVEIWGDSGRVIVFPASTSEENRIEKSVCQVVFEQLTSEYEELADSDVDDDEFATRWKAIAEIWADRVIAVARNTELKGMQFVIMDADDEQPIRESSF